MLCACVIERAAQPTFPERLSKAKHYDNRISNLGRLCAGVLHFGVLTTEDWELYCDRANTDRSNANRSNANGRATGATGAVEGEGRDAIGAAPMPWEEGAALVKVASWSEDAT